MMENYTNITSSYSSLLPLWVCQCGFESCKPRHTFGPAVRDHFLIHYITKGKGTFTNQYGTFSLSANQGFLIIPDEMTVYMADELDPWEYHWVGFKGDAAKDLLLKVGLSNTSPIFSYPNPSLGFEYLSKMFHASKDYKTAETNMIGYLYLFLSPLIGAHTSTISPQTSTLLYFNHAKKYIEDNFSYDITISTLAKTIGIDRTYLYKIFKQETGLSPEQYITDFRLKKARDFLKLTPYTISQIAYSTGFKDVCYFCRVFKKHQGMSPKNFRNHSN